MRATVFSLIIFATSMHSSPVNPEQKQMWITDTPVNLNGQRLQKQARHTSKVPPLLRWSGYYVLNVSKEGPEIIPVTRVFENQELVRSSISYTLPHLYLQESLRFIPTN